MKKWIAALLTSTCLFGSMSAMAQTPDQLIFEAGFFTANLYYCDAAQGVAVFKNVKPTSTRSAQNKTALEAQYNELRISGTIRLSDGSVVSLDECNRYVDAKVRILLTRSMADGLRIVQMKFL